MMLEGKDLGSSSVNVSTMLGGELPLNYLKDGDNKKGKKRKWKKYRPRDIELILES